MKTKKSLGLVLLFLFINVVLSGCVSSNSPVIVVSTSVPSVVSTTTPISTNSPGPIKASQIIRRQVDINKNIGNSIGNLNIGGQVCEYDGWIYYSNPSNSCLYKMKSSGGYIQKLTTEPTWSYFIINHWIYYKSDDTNEIKRVKTDGSENSVVLKRAISDFFIYKDSIFYNKIPKDGGIDRRLTKYNLRTKISTEIKKARDFTEFDNFGSFHLVGKKFFFAQLNQGINSLWSYDLNSFKVEERKVSDPEKYNYGMDYNGFTYFTKDKTIYRVPIEGGAKEVLVKSNDYSYSFNVNNNEFYYSTNKGIFSINLENKKRSKISSESSDSLYLCNEWIFYYVYPHNGDTQLFKMRYDGSELSQVT